MRGVKQKEMFEISDLRRKVLGDSSSLVSLSIFPPRGGGKGYSDMFIHTWAQTFEFQYFGGFQKTEHF